jgi:hypothetical protein
MKRAYRQSNGITAGSRGGSLVHRNPNKVSGASRQPLAGIAVQQRSTGRKKSLD